MAVVKTPEINENRLRKITSEKIPANWLFLDTETQQRRSGKVEIHTFRLGWTCLWQRKQSSSSKRHTWTFFDDPTSFNSYLDITARKMGKLVCVGHNIYFDLQVSGFFDYFTSQGWELAFLYDRAKTFILKCTRDKKYFIVLSTTNWFDQSLQSIGEVLGLEKLDIDFEKTTDEELKTYCHRDVEIIIRAMKYYVDFIKRHSLAKFSFSKASQAFNAYRFRFLKERIMIHREENAISLERAAYMGGRTECYRLGNIGGKDFVTLDINSMYPYVMKHYSYPCKLSEYIENPSVERLQRVLKNFCVVAHVDLNTPEPAFAVRYKKKIVFPTGHFDAYLCSEGLKLAIAKGWVKKIHAAAIYRHADLFSEYVNYFHKLRTKYKRSDNAIMDLLCKYMENSLSGKWGQKYQTEERSPAYTGHNYYREEIYDMVTRERIIKTWLMNQLIVRSGEVEGRNSFVAVVAHITENARLLLWSLISEIGTDKVLYCDTDSIKLRSDDLDLVKWPIDQYELGALKVESRSKNLFIGGNKYYVTEDNCHIKGIPRNAIEVSPGVYEFLSWPKMTYHLRQEIITGYHRLPVRRRINLNYDKGVVHPEGHVTPFHFPLPE
ncbi:hypothetical protein ES707_06692 [subsurface metagenome]